VGTDTLVVVDIRNRFPSINLFSISVTGADPTTSLSIAHVPDVMTVDRPMQPYDGNVGQIRAVNAQTGLFITVTPNGGGSVFVGLRTIETIPTDPNESDIPIRRIKNSLL